MYTSATTDIPLFNEEENHVGFIKDIHCKLSPLPPTPEQIELYYDDGECDMGIAEAANQTRGFGVKFDHPEPGTKYRVESAKIFIFPKWQAYSPEPLRLFVYLYNPSLLTYEKVYENIASGLTRRWNVIDLKPYNIVTEQDFIIGVNWVLNETPILAIDEDTEYHSGQFQVDETTNFIHWGYNFMIRAYVAVYPPAPPTPVGGKATPIYIPINKPALQTPWILLTTIILPLLATVVYVKFKKKKQ